MTFEDFANTQHNPFADDLYTASDEMYTGLGSTIVDYNGDFEEYEDPADYHRKTLTGWRR